MAGLIRVAVVDDHPATAEGLTALLAGQPDLEIVGSAGDLAAARQLIVAARPDVVLCDIELADGRGFELLASRAAAAPAIVFLTSYDYPAFLATALERGAAGYLLKTAPVTEILRAIRTVAGGGSAFSLHELRIARRAVRRPSARELEVVRLVAAGGSNEGVATALEIESATVESHLRRLFARCGVANRTELVVFAIREGWIELPPGSDPAFPGDKQGRRRSG